MAYIIRGDGEMAQKVIDEDNVTCQHMHLILRWLKIRREIEFEAIMIRILSHFKIFELKKVSHFDQKTRDQYFVAKIREK